MERKNKDKNGAPRTAKGKRLRGFEPTRKPARAARRPDPIPADPAPAAPAGALGPCREAEELRLKLDVLREEAAKLFEEYDNLVGTVAPNCKALYAMKVGQLEYRVFDLQTEIRRWQRRLELRQVALNRGEIPDPDAIEAALDGEFGEYVKELRRRIEELKAADRHCRTKKLSPEEEKAVRDAYRSAVKRLHPDLNPDLPEAASDLWHRIQRANAARNWKELLFLASLVDDVLAGVRDAPPAPTGVDALREACTRLEEKVAEIGNRIEEVRRTPPVSWRELLEDKEKLAEVQARLQARIAELETCVAELEEIWNHGK